MTDSPATQVPIDPREQKILDHLLAIRDSLSVLKQDKSTYIKSHDVVCLHDQVMEQVTLLNEIRIENRHEQNRVDKVLDDCFQLTSLSFLTIGRNNEAPAVYATTSTIKRLLDHLAEAAPLFCEKDLDSINHTLEHMRGIIERGKDDYSEHLLTLLDARLEACGGQLSHLQNYLSNLSPDLAPIHEKLISILRSISAANTRQKFPAAEVDAFRSQLNDIAKSKVDGNFIAENGTIPDGQEIMSDLLDRCQKWAEMVLERHGKFDKGFNPIYDRLCDIRNQLEKLSLTQAWSLRETDLYGFQRQLDRIDEARINSQFVDEQGNVADLFCQRTLLYLLRRNYAYIYSLILSSEPVSEALLPVFNQLQTLRRCLLEVKKSGGVASPRELYPYSMKLNSIDNMQVDGKFMVGSDIPEGQGSVKSLLAECFDLCHDLRMEAEEDLHDT